MKQREFPNNDNLGYSGSGVTIMPWTLNPSMKISEYRGNNTSATVASSKINKGINTLAANKYNHHHHHHHHY